MTDELLEIREAEGAFERIEEWLRARGFFGAGGDELVADLYLGYGLSDTIRRDTSTPPPEPCPALPLAACRLGSNPLVTDRHKDVVRVGEWVRSWDAGEYRAAIDEVRAAIERGDVYQVNLVQHLQAPFDGDPAALASRLRRLSPRHPIRSWRTSGRSSRPRRSSSSPAGETGSGRCRSRGLGRAARPPSCARPRRTRRST